MHRKAKHVCYRSGQQTKGSKVRELRSFVRYLVCRDVRIQFGASATGHQESRI